MPVSSSPPAATTCRTRSIRWAARCPFETAALMILAAHLSPADAWAAVTDDARRAVHRPPLAVAPGAPADLVAVRAASLRAAIATGPPERIVWRRGRRSGRRRHPGAVNSNRAISPRAAQKASTAPANS